jgi:hypothetical protein
MVSLAVQFFYLINYRVLASAQGIVRQEFIPSASAVRVLNVAGNTICCICAKARIAIRRPRAVVWYV